MKISVISVISVLFFLLMFKLLDLERQMIFYPSKFPEGYWDTSQFPGSIEESFFRAADGVVLHGWFVHALPVEHLEENQRRTLLFFHGNAGNLTHRITNIAYLVQRGMNVFIFDYRGYGKSEGTPDEQGLYADAIAAYEYLISRNDINKDKIVFFGRSIGGAIAVDLAIKKPCEKLILESTFTSIKDMTRIMFGILPLHYLVQTKFDSISKIRKIHVPLLYIHGNQDTIVPFELGKRLFATANEPKFFYEIQGAGHNDTYEVGGSEYFKRFAEFVNH